MKKEKKEKKRKKDKKKKKVERDDYEPEPVVVRRRYGNVPPPIDWDSVKDLGKVPDSEIADRLGVRPQSVWNARQVRGIPACGTAKKTRNRR